jgi:hypothetical protein
MLTMALKANLLYLMHLSLNRDINMIVINFVNTIPMVELINFFGVIALTIFWKVYLFTKHKNIGCIKTMDWLAYKTAWVNLCQKKFYPLCETDYVRLVFCHCEKTGHNSYLTWSYNNWSVLFLKTNYWLLF